MTQYLESPRQRLKLDPKKLRIFRSAGRRRSRASIHNEVRDATVVAWTSSPRATRRSDQALSKRIARDALGEAAIQPWIHGHDVNGVLAMRGEVDHLSILIDTEIIGHFAGDHQFRLAHWIEAGWVDLARSQRFPS